MDRSNVDRDQSGPVFFAAVWQATSMSWRPGEDLNLGHHSITITTLMVEEDKGTGKVGFYVADTPLGLLDMYEHIEGQVTLIPKSNGLCDPEKIPETLLGRGAVRYDQEHLAAHAHRYLIDKRFRDGYQVNKLRWDARSIRWVSTEQ